ncbi:hypothetical protein N7G274_005034 [Stereocaulon virgatum]|uniref:Uncharacterized protein n=1 Tax=Stereocaulon virgatum TaxID=373712 RepID=A0ABR4ABQ3_9LECA
MHYSDKIAVRNANGGEMKPEHRLPPLIHGYLPFPAGFLMFEWTTQLHVHWIVPILVNSLTGIVVIFIYIYLVDCYPMYAASSLAAVSFPPSISSAGPPTC